MDDNHKDCLLEGNIIFFKKKKSGNSSYWNDTKNGRVWFRNAEMRFLKI